MVAKSSILIAYNDIYFSNTLCNLPCKQQSNKTTHEDSGFVKSKFTRQKSNQEAFLLGV